MPYNNNKELPKNVQSHLPKHAQDLYRESYNNAYKKFKNLHKNRNSDEPLEKICHRAAWRSVKKMYARREDGNWHGKCPEYVHRISLYQK